MSKKTRKKTSKTTSGKASGKTSKAAPGKPSSKIAKKTSQKTSKKTSKTAPGKASRAQAAKPAKKAAAKARPPSSKKPSVARESDVSKPVLAEGKKAPAFRLPRDGGGIVSLADYSGRKLVLFFYPRADTPGCTKEAIDFTRLSGAFAESRTAVLGVSADPLKAQEAFRDKHELSVPLISDEKHEMLEAYGVWGEKSMYGRTFLGILRTTVLIGADSKVVRIWRHVKVDGHADEVLAAARA
jgi:thioredoxin-dependent peroxiredoxin